MKQKKLVITKTPERSELMKLMASEDRNVAYQAQTAFASFLRPIVQRLLDQKATVNYIYSDVAIGKNDKPTVPLDPYVNYHEGEFRVWAQTVAGGLPTNYTQGLSEMPFIFYTLNSAMSLNKDYIEQARVDLLARAITRVVQEFVAKQERNGWGPILAALANGYSVNNSLNNSISSTVAGRIQPDDINKMIVRATRMYQSFAGGSIEGDYGLTDIFLSPERMADVRSFAYNPVNTVNGGATPNSAGNIALPESVRSDIFKASGAKEFFGITFNELRELGAGGKLATIFGAALAAVPANTLSFTAATNDLLIGLDLNQDVFLRPVKTDDGGGSVKASVDDQFYTRSGKVGWFWELCESRLVLDSRPITGLVV